MSARKWMVLASLLTIAPTPARAYFEDVAVGARGLSLGQSAVALVDDASAYYWNPAALADLKRTEGIVDYEKPFALPDANAGAIVLGTRRLGAGWALAWHHLGISSAYAEDQICIAGGRELVQITGAGSLAGGATFKYGRIGFQPFPDPVTGASIDYGSQAKGSLDVGLRWSTPWDIDVAFVSRDLLQPRYEFIAGSGGQLQASRQELAAAFHWNRESTITVGWAQIGPTQTSTSAAIEIQFYDVFAIRSGISNLSTVYAALGSPNDLEFNGGFGVYHHGYYVDAAAITSHDLGATYRVSLRAPFGGKASR